MRALEERWIGGKMGLEKKCQDPGPKGVVTRTEALSALNDMFKQAEAVPEMTLDEINAEIADVRAARKVVK